MTRQLGLGFGHALIWALAAICPVSLSAQDKSEPMVKAADAPGVLKAIKQAGFKAEFKPREGDDSIASIEVVTRDGTVYVQFSDCEDAVPDFCETLVLSTSWDRESPIADAVIADANRNHKYVSIWKDEEGDPIMQWAILTGESGIAAPLFLNALQRYLDVARDFDEVAFKDNETADTPVAATPAA